MQERYITSKENTLVKRALKLRSSKSFRKKEREFIIEGARLCEDAVKSNVIIKSFLYTKKAAEKYKKAVEIIKNKALEVFIISDDILNYISDIKTPQGLVCLCTILDKTLSLDKISSKDKIIAIENIQDPSNLGTILRTAEALGISGIVLSEDCCDIYNPKALRGSMGAVFRLPFFISQSLTKDIKLMDDRMKVYAAVPDKKAPSVKDLKFEAPCMVVIGNEGNGLKNETVKACFSKVSIPINGKSESLNASAAAAILMWEMVK